MVLRVSTIDRKEKRMSKIVYVEETLSVTNSCFACNLAGETCSECQESKDNQLTILAHDFVDEGNLQYKKVWSSEGEISGHEWVSPLVRMPNGIREEYMEVTVNLEDRIDNRELELGRGEKVCNDCHLAFWIRLIDCPVCKEVN